MHVLSFKYQENKHRCSNRLFRCRVRTIYTTMNGGLIKVDQSFGKTYQAVAQVSLGGGYGGLMW